MFSRIFGPRRAEPMLVDLIPIVEDWRPQVLVCDQAELAGPIAAALGTQTTLVAMSAVGVACALAFLAVPEVRALPRRGDAAVETAA